MNRAMTQWMDRVGLDRRKTILAALLMLAMLALWGRLLLSGQPRTAAAETSGASTATVVKTPPAVVHVSLTEELAGDPFAVNLIPTPLTPTVKIEPAFPVTPKLQPVSTDIPSRQTTLVLQSTMLGQRPRAVINGQVVAPGQTIHGHRLIEVRPREVVLERNGVQIVLGM